MSAKNKKTILLLLVAAVLLAVVPFFAKKGAEFGGSDDAGSVMVEEIKGEAYEPWFTPVIESLTGSELPVRLSITGVNHGYRKSYRK